MEEGLAQLEGFDDEDTVVEAEHVGVDYNMAAVVEGLALGQEKDQQEDERLDRVHYKERQQDDELWVRVQDKVRQGQGLEQPVAGQLLGHMEGYNRALGRRLGHLELRLFCVPLLAF